jgi:hypothetical protein
MAVYRDDVAALDARHAALSHELQAKTRELAEASRLLDEAKTRARLPVLDNIRVATPCSADWASMTGDERTRACAGCKKNVYNLSNLTREEAQALIVEREGKLCVRYFQRHDGTILLKDCSIGVGKKRRRTLIAAGAAALLAGVGGWIVLANRTTEAFEPGCSLPASYAPEAPATQVTHEAAPHHGYEAMMGDMAY